MAAKRWWNVKHPRAYADRLAAGESPAAETEPLTADDLALESVMLRVRLADGIPIADLGAAPSAIAALIADGLIDGAAAIGGTYGSRFADGCSRTAWSANLLDEANDCAGCGSTRPWFAATAARIDITIRIDAVGNHERDDHDRAQRRR